MGNGCSSLHEDTAPSCPHVHSLQEETPPTHATSTTTHWASGHQLESIVVPSTSTTASETKPFDNIKWTPVTATLNETIRKDMERQRRMRRAQVVPVGVQVSGARAGSSDDGQSRVRRTNPLRVPLRSSAPSWSSSNYDSADDELPPNCHRLTLVVALPVAAAR